ncbi:MAG: C39 family peptidase [Ruthenibacterium sp.]
MTENLFLWNSAAAFARGTFENVVCAQDTLTLEKAEDGSFHTGCFTSEETNTAPFGALIASWNTDTPADTATEVQVRVRVADGWSAWMRYGKWTPLTTRASAAPVTAENGVSMDTDVVRIAASGGAHGFQLRIFLHTNNPQQAPTVRLLGASIRPRQWLRESGDTLHRAVPVPAYSQTLRDPNLAQNIAAPMAVTMLMNRWGEDLLPEEVAHFSADAAANCTVNRSFTAAAAGCYGYECVVCYADLASLKKEMRNGFACAICVNYASDAQTADAENLPLLAGASCTAKAHTLVIRGFETCDDSTEYVLVNDALADTDDTAQRRYLLCEVNAAWDGVAYFLHNKQYADTLCPPARVCASLQNGEVPGEWALSIKGERTSLPLDYLAKNGRCTGTVCYALRDEHAYATTAHKRFYYGDISQNGNLMLDTAQMPVGTKMTVFLIGETGRTIVAELKL